MSLPSNDSPSELRFRSSYPKPWKEDDLMISRSYPKTGEWIMVGDRVVLDEVHPGKVVGVFAPQTKDAEDYSCSDTGGLLIETESFGLMLLPFGSSQEIQRVED